MDNSKRVELLKELAEEVGYSLVEKPRNYNPMLDDKCVGRYKHILDIDIDNRPGGKYSLCRFNDPDCDVYHCGFCSCDD